MNSEKVKEIKDSIQRKINRAENFGDDLVNCVSVIALKEYLTLINELESENERLNKSDTSKENAMNEYYNLYKDFKSENQQLKDRIAELEKEIEENALRRKLADAEAENKRLSTKIGQILLSIDTVKEMNAMCNIDDHIKKAVKEFAEKLKDYLEDKLIDEFEDMASDVKYLTIDIDEFEQYVDELLKEYEK